MAPSFDARATKRDVMVPGAPSRDEIEPSFDAVAMETTYLRVRISVDLLGSYCVNTVKVKG